MIVEFRCNSRCLTYKPGRVYTAELTPMLKGILDQDQHLSLIDPPTLDPQPTPKPKSKSEPKPNTTMKIEEEKLDDGHQENI